MISFYDFSHKRAKRIGGAIGFVLGILLIIKVMPPLYAVDNPQAAGVPDPAVMETTAPAEPTPEPAADRSAIDAQAPGAAAKNDLLSVDHIDGNSILTVEDVGVYYDFDDHGYMSVGLDGTALPYDVYYGIEVSIDGPLFTVTWHNYSGADVTPTTVTVYSPYYDFREVVGDLNVSRTVTAEKAPNGPYEVRVGWTSGAVTTVALYKNGDDLYTCQTTDKSSEYICQWYDRKNAIDGLLAEAGATPENSLDYSDARWAYPVPADYGDKYRCDNGRWISLAQELTTEDMSDAQKAVVIHDWMVANLAYDQYKVNDLDNTTRATVHKDYTGKYSMWDTKTGVCADFTTVYCIMLRSLGIPAVSLDENDEHVWNIVYLDGDWVELDLTDDIDRAVYGENVADVVNAEDTVDYDAFGTPYIIDAITPGVHNINRGVYSYSYVTGGVWD